MINKEDNQLTPLMQQYRTIKAQYPDIILFFRLGDFYEMFGDDAVKASPILEVILTKRQTVPMCGIPYHSANNYIRKLIKAGLKIAVCEQLEEPGTTKGIVKRGVVKVITPGTLLEDNLLDSKMNNYLMSVIFSNVNSSLISIAVADISTGDFFTYETNIQSLENEIVKYKPGEIIISQSHAKDEKLQKVLAKFNTLSSTIKDIYTDVTYCENLIKKILKISSLNHFNIAGKPNVISAVGLIFVYVQENQPQTLPILNNIRFLETCDYMLLDGVAIKNLEILRSSTSLKQDGSLLSVIDTTITPMGARLIRNWIIKPLLDIKEIETRQNRTKTFIEKETLRQELIENLKSISDLDRIVSRIISGSANPKELLSLKDSLGSIIIICSKLKELKYYENINLETENKIINRIDSYIEQEAPILLKDGNVIKTGISQELDELRLLSKDAKKYISEIEIKERQATGINNLKIGYTSVFGYYIDVTKSNISSVPAHYIRKQTLTNSERYITQELKVLEEKIISAQDKTIKLETELFVCLRQELAEYAQHILNTSSMIAELDIYLAFAQNAVENNYVCPKMTDGKELVLKNARHPVIEQILKFGDFVANDIDLNDTTKRIMILTGPNMSGKSTYLRQTALIVIMAQIGSFVPCTETTIGIVDKIFTRIGAGDNLVAGESTFMVEMTETANILNQYTDKSLIILDEVGRGTSTYDGMSIAWAILEFFADTDSKYNKGAKILFATHYFELTSLASEDNGIINASVSVKEWEGSVVFLHKIVEGSADKSYGIHVAQLAGVPHKVIKRAYQILQGLEKNINKNFSKLEQDIQPNLFTSIEPEILIELKKLDVDNIKPIDALKLLSDWKEKYKK
ncbi:MAG: DNA mismatch repair protein MutS [Endomicrobiaceae bacterium]|nr:DNA mismatch repair protein MutS [Endomicrobiaceae bacterium]